ncbi:hypothetical protein ACX80U_03810 [Arthrobacter sp. TmT3-37]
MSDTTSDESKAAGSDRDHTVIPSHLWDYAQDQSVLTEAAQDIRRYLEELARRGSINLHTIESRAKSLSSYQNKSEKELEDGSRKYSDPATQIHDCVAARVIVFTTRTRNDLADLIENHAEVIERVNPGDLKHNGYDSEHLVIKSLKKQDERARYGALGKYFEKYRGLEIQIRSVAGHAWAEYEHDLRYKSGAYQELSDDGKGQINQWFIEAGGMRRYMDEIFERIEARVFIGEQELPQPVDREPPLAQQEGDDIDDDLAEYDDPRPLDEEALRDVITARFPGYDTGQTGAVEELLTHLEQLRVSTVGELEAALVNLEQGQVARLMDYPSDTSGVRRLDDELLATFTDTYVETALGEDRKQFLRLRLRRVRGKFAIYTVEVAKRPSRLLTAASAVRETAKLVANLGGVDLVSIEGAISTERNHLNPSTKARTIRTQHGPIFVATNMTRSWAESIIKELIRRVPNHSIRVLRAGDLLIESSASKLL